jgi:putative ABC transport system permease protein
MWNNLLSSAFLAYKSILKGNRAVLVLTPLVISFSIANLVFSSSLFTGMIHSLEGQLIDNLFSNILIEPQDDHVYITSVDSIVKAVSRIDGVVAVAPHYKASGQFSFDPEKDNMHVTRRGYQIIGVDPAIEPNVTKISRSMLEGRYLEPEDRDNIVIGAEVAGGGKGSFEKLSLGGVNVSDKVRISYGNGVAREYKVVGIFKTGMDGIDIMTFITRKEYEAVHGVADSAHEIMVRLPKLGNEENIIREIRALGYTKEKIGPWSSFSNFTASMSNSFSILNFITGIISLVVACTTIFIVIFIHVVNKKRQLGILKAIGVSERIIINSYIMQTLFYGVAGSLLSAFIMYGIANPYFNHNPLDMGFAKVKLLIEPWEMFKDTAIIVVAGLISGFLPAWITVRQSIIKAIWG